MLRLIVTLVLFFQFISSNAQTQLEMNQAAKKEYEKSEKKINSVYQTILKKYQTDLVFIKNLRAAQRLWIQFRDAEMKAIFPDREGNFYGSVHSMCWFNYLTHLTNERIEKLNFWLKGVEEGDVCTTSVQ